MIIIRSRACRRFGMVLATVLVVSPVCAEKPQKAEGGKHQQKSHKEKNHDDFQHADGKAHSQQQNQYEQEHYFNNHHRDIVSTYYRDEFRRGDCPPGLAKKHNGCLPPGQAKRWTLGKPLPGDVIVYDLPDTVIRQIGYPPAGYRFVRVASDILMITIGAGMVVDAITDLNAMP